MSNVLERTVGTEQNRTEQTTPTATSKRRKVEREYIVARDLHQVISSNDDDDDEKVVPSGAAAISERLSRKTEIRLWKFVSLALSLDCLLFVFVH